MKFAITLCLCLCLLFAGCASTSTQTTAGSADGGRPPTSPTDNNKTGIWKPTSARLELSARDFLDGGFGYERTREEMSSDQILALERLTLTEPREGFAANSTTFEIRITDRDGSVAEFRAAELNLQNQPERPSVPTIEIGTLNVFLQSLNCQRAKNPPLLTVERSDDTRLDPSTVDLTTVTSFPNRADPGCHHGVNLPSRCGDTLIKWSPPDAGDYTFTMRRCFETLSLRVFSADGKTMLAEAAPGPNKAESCVSVLAPALDPLKDYVVMITKTNAAGCATTTDSVDATIQVTR